MISEDRFNCEVDDGPGGMIPGWTCDNGGCTYATNHCDGFEDCNDGSDESDANCPDGKYNQNGPGQWDGK